MHRCVAHPAWYISLPRKPVLSLSPGFAVRRCRQDCGDCLGSVAFERKEVRGAGGGEKCVDEGRGWGESAELDVTLDVR